jgi:predicted nucleotidyltransferase
MAGVLDARGALAEVTSILMGHFGAGLRGLYLFGSLAAGGFRPGRSDIDLLAVLSDEVREGEPLETLRSLHDDFASRHPEWLDRIEVGYISHAVLQSFSDGPAGRVAVISPGEALNVKDVEANWVIDWYGVCTMGETLIGPPPTELGPAVTKDAYLRAVQEHLGAWKEHVRQSWVAYVPAHQGYIVATVCRALYTLASGKQTTKELAVAWAAERFPDSATFINQAFQQYLADVSAPHRETIRFVDQVIASARRAE